MTYPSWRYFPRNVRPPQWALDLVEATAQVAADVDTRDAPAADTAKDTTSDAVLARLRPGMQTLGYQVESGKKAAEKIRRPVLFGDDGTPEISYEIDAFHDGLGIAVEVEAGRGAANNADFRDIVRTSLLLDADYLALFMPQVYRSNKGSTGKFDEKRAYKNTVGLLDAVYASQRLRLPFKGVLVVGY